jgi:DNA sulfur modification protein DndD
MAIDLRITGWKAQGLRCPDHEVSFVNGENKVYPISLLQMPNGTGKTTTLTLLRACLSGAAESEGWDAEKVGSFQKRESEEDTGTFKVDLLANKKRVTFTMTFDFDEGNVRYSTTTGPGIREGFHPPRELQKFLRPSFVRFFVFDGELAEQLLSREHTNAQVVIEDLFQIGLFTSMSNHIRDYWDQQTEKKGATEGKGLTQRKNRVDKLANRLTKLKAEQATKKEEADRVRRELEKKQAKFKTEIAAQKELAGKLSKTESDLAAETERVRSGSRSLLEQMRSPQYLSAVFAEEMTKLKDSLDRVKLPESTAREFFEELAQDKECVCGTVLDDTTREAIRKRASQYLGADNVSLLNAMKSDIGSMVGKDPTVHEKALCESIETLVEHCRKQEEYRTARDAVQAEGVAADPALQQAEKEIDELEKRLTILENELAEYDSTDGVAGDDCTGIKMIEKRLNDAEEKLAEITKTIELRAKRDILVGILEAAHKAARKGISAELCDEANERIEDLMPHNAIRVKEINRCLVLRGQEGGSAGETLSVGYAWSRASPRKIPNKTVGQVTALGQK